MAAAYEKAKIEIKAVAQKQLGIDLSVVSPLVDSEWPDFLQQIKTCVFRNEWEPGVLNYKDDAGADIAIPPHIKLLTVTRSSSNSMQTSKTVIKSSSPNVKNTQSPPY